MILKSTFEINFNLVFLTDGLLFHMCSSSDCESSWTQEERDWVEHRHPVWGEGLSYSDCWVDMDARWRTDGLLAKWVCYQSLHLTLLNFIVLYSQTQIRSTLS